MNPNAVKLAAGGMSTPRATAFWPGPVGRHLSDWRNFPMGVFETWVGSTCQPFQPRTGAVGGVGVCPSLQQLDQRADVPPSEGGGQWAGNESQVGGASEPTVATCLFCLKLQLN